ncbi:ribosome maturation factor RimM [Lacibacterium aquatile]|uniref:Ribosome maturation factor RimM n=1 Tax=Lacibacterium aquatile TaxID=1168082 RepID=A0ABW5DWK2_9PROT
MNAPRPNLADFVCVGNFSGSHGVRGLVRVRSFTASPRDLTAYGPLTDENGKVWVLTLTGMAPKGAKADVLVAQAKGQGNAKGLANREDAQALNGLKLYVPREALPAPEDDDDFYQADLIGCTAFTAEGQEVGRVKAFHDFGAGDVLEIGRVLGGTLLLPFTRACVPAVDIAAKRLTIQEPIEIDGEDRGQGDADEAAEGAV